MMGKEEDAKASRRIASGVGRATDKPRKTAGV
jgi:hypothetical protein